MRPQTIIELKYSTLALQHLVLKKTAAQLAHMYGVTPAEMSKALVDLGIKKARGASEAKSYLIKLVNDSNEFLEKSSGPAATAPTAIATSVESAPTTENVVEAVF